MPPPPSTAVTRRRLFRWSLWLLLAGVLAYGAWQGVLALVRSHTNTKIQGAVDRPLPPFRLVATDGTTFDSATLAGRTVVLNFFRSRCEACEREAPAIRELSRTVDPARVTVLGIFCDRLQDYPADESAATLARKAYAHTVLWADRAFADAFHGAGWTNVTPVTYVADGRGRIVRALRGAQTVDALRAALP